MRLDNYKCEAKSKREFFGFLKWFFDWAKGNPVKFICVLMTITFIVLSAIAAVGLVLWFFVIHPELIIKALVVSA